MCVYIDVCMFTKRVVRGIRVGREPQIAAHTQIHTRAAVDSTIPVSHNQQREAIGFHGNQITRRDLRGLDEGHPFFLHVCVCVCLYVHVR